MQLFFSNLLEELIEDIPISYATIVSKKGSTPQVPGASAIFDPDRLLHGTLGGGILEGEIQLKAQAALRSKTDLVVEYNLDANIHDDTGAICGGYATILIDTHPEDHIEVFKKLNTSLGSNIPGVLVTMIEPDLNKNKKIHRYWVPTVETIGLDVAPIYDDIEQDIKKVLQERVPLLKKLEDTDGFVFLEPIFPDPQLIIVGAGHIGKALSHLGRLLDFHVTVIDDRQEHANRENIPDAYRILSENIETDLASITVTDNTYIVIVTQGHKKDAVALKQYIHSQAAYIGMIGSKRKTRLMKEDFIAKGWAKKDELDRIYAPIGIDIQSKTVQEIAISIAGQLVQVRQAKYAAEKGRNIDIIILAAGKSERMGQQKLLMPYAKTSILENIISKALASDAGEVYVVTGSHRKEVSESIKHLPVKLVFNRDYERGMLSSVQCGFNGLSSTAKAGLILLGDQPMVQTAVINKLIESYYKSGKGIVIPVYKGKKGHPVLIDVKYRDQINALDPAIGLRQLVDEKAYDIHEIEVENNTILKDIDTIEDYKKELI